MKTKLTKMIMSSLAFACALVCLAAAMALGTSATARAAADGRVCSVDMLRGLYLWTFDGYAKLRWEPGTESRYARPPVQRRWYDVSIHFGTVNIGGTIIIDATGGAGTYTVAPDCTGTLIISRPDGPSFNMYVGPGAQKVWSHPDCGPRCWRRHRSGCRNGDTAAVVKARDDIERLNE